MARRPFLMLRTALAVSFAAASFLTAPLAVASEGPQEAVCTNKPVGSECRFSTSPGQEQSGKCESTTCARVVFEPKPDSGPDSGTGSNDSKTVSEPCVLCKTDAKHEDDDSGCVVGAGPGVKSAEPLAFAALVPIAMLLVGRRRRRS